MINIGTDFTGVGSVNQALMRLGIQFKEVFACEMDKYARQTYIHNYGKPEYYPKDVYDRQIPKEPLDLFVTTPPCQSFSLAGKRKGEEDKRGILFYNSHEFISVNKPRYFCFENVKGLLSSKSAITYENSLYLLLYNFKQIKEWESLSYQKSNLNLLSQSITNYLCLNYAKKLGLKNQTSGMFYTTNSELGYEKLETKVKSGLKRRLKFLEERIYQIMKKYNYCQTERIQRLEELEQDLDLNQNQFYLIENLSPVVTSLLEKTVDINASTSLFANNILEENSKKGKLYTTLTEINSTMTSKTFMYVLEMNIIRLIILALDLSSNLWKEIWLILIGKKEFIGLKTFDIWLFNLDHINYKVHYQVLNAKDYGVPQNRERIFIIGIRDDADNNFTFPKPFTLVKRLKDVLEENVDEKYYLSEKIISFFKKHTEKHTEKGNGFNFKPKSEKDIGNCVTARCFKMGIDDNYISIVAIRGRNPENPKSRESGLPTQQMLEVNESGTSNCLATVQKDNVVIEHDYRIRKLTPRECFRLMDFPDTFDFSVVSDSQAYKQAGNSVVVKMWELIFKKLFIK